MTNSELISLQQISPSSTIDATIQQQQQQHQNSPRQINLKRFSANFWGEKTLGFDVLCQNLRTSLASVKELEAFIKDTQQIEETYAKQTSKLSVQVGRYSTESSAAPLWHTAVRESCERDAWSHLHFGTRMQELLRDVQAYATELRKKRKRMKEVEARTAVCVEQFRAAKAHLTRARDLYLSVAADVDRMRKLNSSSSSAAAVSGDLSNGDKQIVNASTAPLQQSNSASSIGNFQLGIIANSLQKMEKKLQQATEEYKQAVERYNASRDDYIKLFSDSCHSFETYEEAHVQQMSKFVGVYATSMEQLNRQRQEVNAALRQKLENVCGVEALIEQFLAVRGTGHDIPQLAEFVEYTADSVVAASNDVIDAAVTSPTANDGAAADSVTPHFLHRKKRSIHSPVRGKHENQNVLDPFEMTPSSSQHNRSVTPTSGSEAATTTTTTTSGGVRKRNLADNRLLGIFNLDFLGKIKNSTTSPQTPTDAVKRAAANTTNNRNSSDGSNANEVVAEPQLIDLSVDTTVNNIEDNKMTESTTKTTSSRTEMFQRARPMRIIAKVTTKKKKRQMQSFPSSEPEKAAASDDDTATTTTTVKKKVTVESVDKRARSKTAVVGSSSSDTTTVMKPVNGSIDDDDFDDSAFRTKGILHVDDDDIYDDDDDEDEDFFRELEEFNKLKKDSTITNLSKVDAALAAAAAAATEKNKRKHSADMNNLYETSSSSQDSSVKTRVDLNNNDVNLNLVVAAKSVVAATAEYDSSTDDDSDTDSDDSDAPKKIHVHIKPVSSTAATSDMVLNQIGKTLKLASTPTRSSPMRALSPSIPVRPPPLPSPTPTASASSSPMLPLSMPPPSSTPIKSIDEVDDDANALSTSLGGLSLMKFKKTTQFEASLPPPPSPPSPPQPTASTTPTTKRVPPLPPMPLSLKLKSVFHPATMSQPPPTSISTNLTTSTTNTNNTNKNSFDVIDNSNATDFVIKF